MKKFVSLLLALVMVLSLAACNNDQTGDNSKAPENSGAPSQGLGEYVPTTYEDEVLYMDALGDFYEALQVAQKAESADEMYALMAVAEAKLMESGTFVTYCGDDGYYRMSRMVDKSVPTVQWGTDYRRYETALVTNEPLKAADRQELIAMWNELAGTGTYEQSAKDFLAEKGYTLKDSLGYWEYTLDPETWDTLSAWTSSVGDPVCGTVEGLVKYDMENVLQPALAESWENSEDGLTWTFHIREGAVWTDYQGRKVADVKADDWVASMQHMFDCYGDSGAEAIAPNIVNGVEYSFGEITDFSQVGVEAVDDHTLVYHLTQRVNSFESMLTYCGFFAPLCREYYTSQGGTFGRADHVSGNYGLTSTNIAYCGPYLVTSHVDRNSIVYEANPSYWNYDNMNIKKITWPFEEGTDPLKTYHDFNDGTIDVCDMGPNGIQQAKTDGLFDDYAMTGDLKNTTRVGFTNLNRQSFALFNNPGVSTSNKTHESTDEIDRNGGVFTSDILDDQARTHAAMNNHNFRLAMSYGFDRVNYQGQAVGEDLKEMSIRNTYTPGNFVQLSEDTTIDINGTPTTFEAGTYYGAMIQAQITADGYPIKVWDPDANGGMGSGDGFDGFYNVDNARECMAKAVEELAAQGIEISKENPIIIDFTYASYSETATNRANAYKQSIESALEGLVRVDLFGMNDSEQLNSTSFRCKTGAEVSCDFPIGTGWSADFADPYSYLANVLPYGDGYQTKNLGLWGGG